MVSDGITSAALAKQPRIVSLARSLRVVNHKNVAMNCNRNQLGSGSAQCLSKLILNAANDLRYLCCYPLPCIYPRARVWGYTFRDRSHGPRGFPETFVQVIDLFAEVSSQEDTMFFEVLRERRAILRRFRGLRWLRWLERSSSRLFEAPVGSHKPLVEFCNDVSPLFVELGEPCLMLESS